MAAQSDEERRFTRREVDGWQTVACVEGVAAAPAALRTDGHRGVAEHVEVAVNGAHGHAKAVGERFGRDACPTAAQVFGKSKEPFGASHVAGRNLTYC